MTRDNRRLREELCAQQEEAARSSSHAEKLCGELEREKERERAAWHLNCKQIARYDRKLVEKEHKIAELKAQLEKGRMRTRREEGGASSTGGALEVATSLRGVVHPEPPVGPLSHPVGTHSARGADRRGKAPPL